MNDLDKVESILFSQEKRFRLVDIPGAGRGLISTSLIQPGDIILRDKPVILGPGVAEDGTYCSGCGDISGSNLNLMENCSCGLRFCSVSCKQSWHTEEECRIVSSIPEPKPNQNYWLITLRGLVSEDPRIGFLQELTVQEGAGRSKEEDEVVKLLSSFGFKEKSILTVYRQLTANTFRRGRGRGLCAGVAMVNHSCSPNSRVWWDESGSLVLSARVKITPGDEITLTYCSPLLGQPSRRNKLLQSKGFICRCPRCQDGTELGTYMSSIRCTKCKPGLICPVGLDEDKLGWICSSCGFKPNPEKVSGLLKKVEDELYGLEKEKDPGRKLLLIQQYIEKNKKLFSSDHFLQLRAGDLMVGLMNKLAPSTSCIQTKEYYTRQTLKVLETLDPGLSRFKGFQLFKLYQILFEKIVHSAQGSLKAEEQFQLVQDMQTSLLESKFLLSGDRFAPPEIVENANLLVRALNQEQVEQIQDKINQKYKIVKSVYQCI
ncbi:protein msta [Eurytemora carolleeae]|uniref:protein msta n=1 Tax=Eurytemora carolleeae TaxID=1294199 RepID=UPI000C75C9AE|nr:protein msta [Eurytemora carolleeae]|eukprot:XP_023343748.1 protein msta-like [Eurytemora affinis]